MAVVLLGILALIVAIGIAPPLRMNVGGALLIVLFGFLFVTVSSRLTGEIGSSSNPISGMAIATLLLHRASVLARHAPTEETRLDRALWIAAGVAAKILPCRVRITWFSG